MAQICVNEALLHGRDILENSAHGMFQLGHYYDCLETPGYNYNMVLLAVNGTNTGIFGGLCLPSSCSPQTITETLDGLLLQMGTPFSVGAVINNIQDYSFPYTWVFYLTVIILTATVGLTIFSTVTKSKHRLLKGISIEESMKIFKSKQSDLNILNGVRALAMMLVVFGHQYFNRITNISNAMNINEIFKKPFILLVETGLTAVDIFFFLGGFFLAFVFMRQKSNSMMKYPLAILQRVLRIWPAYVITMMIYYSIYMHLGSGPFWAQQQPSVMMCSQMWRQVLFINNFVDNGNDLCLDWGWYLQVDFQIFIVCIVLLFLYGRINRIASYSLAAILVVGSITFNIVYTQQHQQKLLTDYQAFFNFSDYFLNIYMKPYARWTPYFMGLYLGILYYYYQQSHKHTQLKNNRSVRVMHLIKEKLENNKLLRIVIQWSGIAIMAFLIFILRTLQAGQKWDQIWHSLYACLEKPFFIIGLIMVTFPSVLGCKGSFFRLLLESKILNFMAKISFCTYLVHFMVILQFVSSRTYDNYFSLLDTFTLYLGALVVSCFFGFLMTIFVELPFSIWQKEFMKILKKSKRYQENNQQSQQLIEDKINRTIDNESKLKQAK